MNSAHAQGFDGGEEVEKVERTEQQNLEIQLHRGVLGEDHGQQNEAGRACDKHGYEVVNPKNAPCFPFDQACDERQDEPQNGTTIGVTAAFSTGFSMG